MFIMEKKNKSEQKPAWELCIRIWSQSFEQNWSFLHRFNYYFILFLIIINNYYFLFCQ